MTLNDLVSEVSDRVKRPDLISAITSAVKQATLKLHSLDYFTKDLAIGTFSPLVPTVVGDTRYLIDTSALPFVRFRAALNIREYNSVPTGTELEIKQRPFSDLRDSYGLEYTDYWYFAGVNLSIRAPKALNAVAIEYYQYPDITDAGFASWIARELPYAIVDEACAIIFKRIGKDEEAVIYKKVIEENLILLRTSGGIPGVTV